MEVKLTSVIKDSFLQYSGAVLQSRALCDSRDLLKPSARQIFYCLYTDKFTHDKPFQKTLKAIGSCFRLYIHGDSSAEGIIMRAGQPFAMRYPLTEIEGSYGTLLAAGSWSAPRYTSARLSKLSEYLFKDLDKDTIEEWRDNYDNTEQYPSVLPSKGFYNIVNGSYGIGTGASASIPQYNLQELNQALIKLLWNPEIDFEDIFILPDFATGAILLNADEVKESHRNGRGKACKLRSVIDWDDKERCLIVKEIPYMIYTETICKELEEIINGDNNPGIERFNDLTGKSPLIKIYLSKGVKPDKILRFLYKNTSLQSYYSINFTMLENGRFPKTFTWKELLQSHIDHEIQVYIRGFNYDLLKIKKRLHIIDGLMRAYDCIDEVVNTIKSSSSTQTANIALQNLLGIDNEQAKAILDLKLSRLSKLDINKLKEEADKLQSEREKIETILSDEYLLKKEVEKGLVEVAEKFGDARRTQVLNLSSNDNDEIIEEKKYIIQLSNFNNFYIMETSTLMMTRRNTVGSKIKLASGEYIIKSIAETNLGHIMLFSNKGKFFDIGLQDITNQSMISAYDFLKLSPDEKITEIISYRDTSSYKYIIFITKQGIIKKSLLSEYEVKRSTGAQGIKLKDNDEIVSTLFTNNEKIGIVTKNGQFTIFGHEEIRAIGKVAAGVKGIELREGDEVVSARLISNNVQEIISITKNGVANRVPIDEFNISQRGGKGVKIQKLEEDNVCSFIPVINEKEVSIASKTSLVKIPVNSIPKTARGSKGVKTIKLTDTNEVTDIFFQ